MPVPGDLPFGSTPQGQAFRANRLLMPSSAHCTATPVAAWRRVIASPLVALASKTAACRVWAALGLAARAQQLGGHVSRSARIAHAQMNQSRSASTRRGCFTPRGGHSKLYRPEFRCSGCHRLIYLKVLVLLGSP